MFWKAYDLKDKVGYKMKISVFLVTTNIHLSNLEALILMETPYRVINQFSNIEEVGVVMSCKMEPRFKKL